MKFLLILALLVFSVTIVIVHADPVPMGSFLVHLEHVSSRVRGETEEMNWDRTRNLCEGRYNASNWNVLPPDSCKTIGSELLTFRKLPPTLDHTTLKNKTHVGILTWNNKQWMVNLAAAEECDEHMKHCHMPALDRPSALAVRLRELLTAKLGRLPIPGEKSSSR